MIILSAFEYKYKIESVHKVSADIAGRVCQELENTEEGLTPKRLVDVSRPEDAPMHKEFEWNDSVAAEKYRENQAYKVIKDLIVVKTDAGKERELNLIEDAPDRAFVSTGENAHKYVSLYTALTNESWRDSLLESAKRDMMAFKAKYHRLTQLSKIIEDIDEIIGA